MDKPIIAIPMGDPSGIGPEIVIKALNTPALYDQTRPFVVGDKGVMQKYIDILGISISLHCVSVPGEGRYIPGTINMLDMNNVDLSALQIGQVQGSSGKAAYEYIEAATKLALDGYADALATTPINKESLRAGHINYIGHTEILAALTGTKDPLTIFEVRNMRVFFLTRHVSLQKAITLCTEARILDYIIRCSKTLEQMGVRDGVMAVAGLNPHCGEHGLFGDEEVVEIEPAVRKAQEMGYRVAGPIGADSVFHQTLMGKYNSVLSLYHDQGHVATKTLDFERTISITAGMPILRTSVDHGTALDIAGKGLASEISMVEAIVLAAKYSPYYNAKV